MIITRGEVTSENHYRTDHDWQKIDNYGNPYIILFLTLYFLSLNTQIC